MKKVLLLGDSIRLGYEKYVKEAFLGVAEVYSPKENCAFAQYLFRWLHWWKKQEEYPDDIDLVHWNVGLWDVLRIYGEDTFISPEYYREMLIRLQRHIQFLFPKAKQVFATSTSVIEEGHKPPYQRYNADIEKFNALAVETLLPLGVDINDLYAITKTAPNSCHSDVTHFYTPQGVKLLGEKVVQNICKQLDIPLSNVKDANAIVPKLTEELIGK